MNNYTWLLLFVFSASISAQTITGKVYNEKSTAKNIGVFNLTTRDYTYTNEEGDFSIEASVSDTLLFSSAFYKPQNLIVQDKHFKTTNIIELKTQVNTLGTVNLSNTPKFSTNKYQANLATQIQNDIKNRPYLYQPPPNPQGDLTLLIDLVKDLFKSKKVKENPVKPMTYKSFYSLFNTNNFFSENLLKNDLNIDPKHIPLFFDYCDTKTLNEDLLKEHNQMILLDSLIKFSKEFNSRIAETDTILNTD
ncbi:hypothetical protein [Aestuariibaculum suncheonense]|uniref:Carboxypeptidase-like protein n=1 Tax=Aestuariibaculum suncheonense TaxID=1028745 RepID=A0A8J6UAR9_9FLAO|nr:hypothetical protein [Aestuariibaculum suncheonense]MBD0834707.1 hypothetical protein [Aestuariibaculum suncheonense]